jgi:hypothetical protein
VPYILARCSGNGTHFAQSRPWDIYVFFVAQNRKERIELFDIMDFPNFDIPRPQNQESLPDNSNVR